MKRWIRQEAGFRLYKVGRSLMERAHRLDDSLPTETRPAVDSLAYGLDDLGLHLSEVLKLAEDRAQASGRTLGEVTARPNSERLLPI